GTPTTPTASTNYTVTVINTCGSTTHNINITVNPSVGTPSFTAGATLVCQDAPNETYTATAANATGGVFYGVEPEEAGVINDVTGVMNWDAAFSGEATITAYA
ncbi:MAG: hypothetical protein ACK4ON_02150, partial [Bacteroidia bacterium]